MLHRREGRGVDEMPGLVVGAHVERNVVGPSEHRVQLVRGQQLVHRRVGSAAPAHREHAHPERFGESGHAPADLSEPHHQQRLFRERHEGPGRPAPLSAPLHVVQEAGVDSQDGADHGLREVGAQDPGAVGDGDPVRVPRRHVVVARSPDVDPPHRGMEYARAVGRTRKSRVLDGEHCFGVVRLQQWHDLFAASRIVEIERRKAVFEKVAAVLRVIVKNRDRTHGATP